MDAVNLPTIAQKAGPKITLETTLLPEEHQDISHQAVSDLHAVLKGPESLTAVLKALLPTAARVSQAEDQVISSPNNRRSDSTFPKLLTLLVFAMANNFAGLNGLPIQETLEYLKRQTNTRLLRHVLSTPGPESEAFAESLFWAAIESEDARVIGVLLEEGLNPNDLVYQVGWVKCTPLQYSSKMQNVEVTRLLLRTKADVNKTLEKGYKWGGAIGWAFKGRQQSRVCLELVRMLLDAGCKAEMKLLERSIEDREMELSEMLVDYWVKTKPFDLASFAIPRMATEYFDNETATRLATRIFQASAKSDHGASPTAHENLAATLDIAAERGNLELVQFLLGSRVSLTEKTLSLAIRSKNRELIRFLLDVGADVDLLPLAEAVRWGDIETIGLLEAEGAWSQIGNDIRKPRAFKAALVAASVGGQLTIVQKLLNLRRPDTYGRDLSYALVAAICAKQEVVALTLLNAGADVNNDWWRDSDIEFFRDETIIRGPALLEVLRQRNTVLFRSLLDANMNIYSNAERGAAALVEAVKWGDHSVIEELIFVGAGVNGVSKESTALAVAVKRKETKCMQLLLNAGADVNSRNSVMTALSAAVINGDIEMVEHLLSIGADPDNSQTLFEAVSQGKLMIEKLLGAFTRRHPLGKRGYGTDALLKAIEQADFLLIEILLEAKIDVNTIDRKAFTASCTPLAMAIEEQHATSLAILQRLLDAGGNPNSIARHYQGYPYRSETAFLVAINTKEIQKVQLLIDAGADCNWPATRGVKRTPLQKAAEIGSFQIAQVIIDNGGLVNAEPAVRNGATALQLAAIGGYIGIAELLLDNDADVNAPPAKVHGRTALEGAAEHGRIDMLKLLWNAGAKFHGCEYERALQLAKETGHMATRRYLESLSSPPE